MNLRRNPTPSQLLQAARIDALTSAVVEAAVAPRSKKPRGGGKGRGAKTGASQKHLLHPPPPPRPSPPPPNLVAKSRAVEVVEDLEATQSPSPLRKQSPPNQPPPSGQRPISRDAFRAELDRDEEELNEISRPQSEEDVAGRAGRQSEDESDSLDLPSQLAPPSKKAKGKRPGQTLENDEAWRYVRVQVQALLGTKILVSFGAHLLVFGAKLAV